jgi:serine/threonine protein kinase/tetratricopeptide (TPR) repeat protein
VAIKCPKCDHQNPDDTIYCGKCTTPLKSSEEISSIPTETQEAPKKELTRGSTFASRYEIIEELGKGGMGKVYRVFDNKLEGEVALKLVKPEIASDKKTIERFRNELKLAREIAHRNVCKMYDLGEEKGTHYITMEYIPGEDLKGMIRMMGRLGAGKAISIAKQVCEGLAEAHRLGVVHRDLKPSNIMIDKEGNTRIMDFGIARSLEAKGITGAGVMIGTPEYMSPEQVEGKETDQRSDVYSLGIILYEMVTGRAPFEGDTPFTVGMKHKGEIPQNPKELNTQISDELNRVILRCLEKEKEKRYQTAGEVHSELKNIEKGIPTTERVIPERKTATSREITVTFQRRWVFIAAPIVIILVAALAFFLLKGGKDVTPPENIMLVVLPFENLGPPEDEYFADGITDEVTNRLSLLHGLDVISRASAIKYKGTEKTIKKIRDELNMDYVVTGTVRWDKSAGEGGRVRVSPQLIRASDDTQLWSENYEHSFKDIFAVQTEIAEEVIKQLDITLLEPERRALREKPTENLEAYDLYLRADEQWDKAEISINRDDYKRAIEMFERVIELDPGFVRAYIDLSRFHSIMYFYGYDRTKERLSKSKAAVDKALELRPDLPEAKRALGYYYYRGFLDYDRALEIFESVQKARPNSSPAPLGYIRRRQGKWEESLEALEKAFRLNPRSSGLSRELGNTNMHMRRYAEAEIWYDRSLSLSPENLNTKVHKIMNSLHLTGNTVEARAILETFPPGRMAGAFRSILNRIEKNFNDTLKSLDSFPGVIVESQDSIVHKDLIYASVYRAQEEISLMKSHADAARIDLEKALREHPEDPRYHSALGLAYAYLGRKDDAIREGYQGIKLYPVSKDAFAGPEYVLQLIQILIIAGDYDDALDKLEYLMSIEAGHQVSISSLRYQPDFDPLRNLPRFKRLLEKYSSED